MKKLSVFMFCLTCAALVYGQSLEMSTIISSTPSIVVDELRVIGSDLSTINNMNIGLKASTDADNNPFQTQTLKLEGNTFISDSIQAGRDLYINEKLDPYQTFVENGNVFTNSKTYGNVETGTLKAHGITLTAINTMNVNKILGGNIYIDGKLIDTPFEKGSNIVMRKVNSNYLAQVIAEEYKQNRKHILHPWEDLTDTPQTEDLCKQNGRPYYACDNGSEFCYDTRTRTISEPVYAANGATYEKIGTAKFYCKSEDTYSDTGVLSSTCRHYMVYSGLNPVTNENILIEGYTNGVGAVANPLDTAIISETTDAVDVVSPAEKCAVLSSNAGASNYFRILNIFDENLQQYVKFTDVFAETCSNADRSSWPIGSGLSCKGKERILDIYMLQCYQGSGKLLRAAATKYQRRKVICRQYDHVVAEQSNAAALGDKAFFYPSFDISYTAAYGDEDSYQSAPVQQQGNY